MTVINWLPNYAFEVEGFLPVERCESLVALAESKGFDAATVHTHSGHVMDSRLRNNDRVTIEDEALTNEMWKLAQVFAPARYKSRDVVGLNERLRFYRYDPAQKFDWHEDGYFERPTGERSQFTFMVYLNDSFEGGATSFADATRRFEPFTVRPKTGSALFFYHHLNHRGDEVVSGRKYVLRTDVMYARKS